MRSRRRSKSHHIVPQFYLKRFLSRRGRLWVLDKVAMRTFEANTRHAACVNAFYELPTSPEPASIDPAFMERQFSRVEAEAARVIGNLLRQVESTPAVALDEEARNSLSLFIVLQALRTLEARSVLIELFELMSAGDSNAPPRPRSSHDQAALHASLLWDDKHVGALVDRVAGRAWIVGVNNSGRGFLTSDHPVLMKTADSRAWVVNTLVHPTLDAALTNDGDYIVFPLSPRCVLYCYDRTRYPALAKLDLTVSPVVFTPDMVDHENSGQIGVSTRFVFSSDGDFGFARQFIDEQPWVRDPTRKRFAERTNPYESPRGKRALE